MEVVITSPSETPEVSALSISVGNIPLFPHHSVVAVLRDGAGIVGFAAAQQAMHAAGSWVREDHRHRGYSYQLRRALDTELVRRGFPVYFALPGNDFEKQLFAKYGPVTERLAQIRHL